LTRPLKLSIVIGTILLSVSLTYAAPAAPIAYNDFDGTPPGARTLGMGYAFCAVGGDPASIYFNPSGLSDIKGNMLGLSFEITRYSDLTYNQVFSNETLANNKLFFIGLVSSQGALSWRPLSNHVTTILDGADFESNEVKISAYTLSASHTSKEGLMTGLNLSYLSGIIGQAKEIGGVPSTNISEGYGFSMDLGLAKALDKNLTVAADLKNILGFMWWDDYETSQLPFTTRLGFSFDITNFLVFAADWERRFYRTSADVPSTFTFFGLEQNLGDVFRLRAGTYGSDLNKKDQTHLTLGLGYQNTGYTLDIGLDKYIVDQTDVFKYLFSLNAPI
jgi:hypothetical protein